MGKENENIEKNVLASIGKGCHVSFEILYETYSQMVFRHAFKSLKCKSEADDIVQQTFVQLWNNKERLKEIRSIKDYTFIVSKNLIFARLRSIMKNELLSEELRFHIQLSRNKSEEDMVYSDIKKIAEKAIESLPERRKLIFKLSKEMDYSQEEIAAKLNISKNTVKESLRKAYSQIRTKLAVEADISFNTLIAVLSYLYD